MGIRKPLAFRRRTIRPWWRTGLKDYTSDLSKRYGGQQLCARGNSVALNGNATDDVWKKYIEAQKPEPADDNFKVI